MPVRKSEVAITVLRYDGNIILAFLKCDIKGDSPTRKESASKQCFNGFAVLLLLAVLVGTGRLSCIAYDHLSRS